MIASRIDKASSHYSPYLNIAPTAHHTFASGFVTQHRRVVMLYHRQVIITQCTQPVTVMTQSTHSERLPLSRRMSVVELEE